MHDRNSDRIKTLEAIFRAAGSEAMTLPDAVDVILGMLDDAYNEGYDDGQFDGRGEQLTRS